MSIKISIIIPVYNENKTISELLEKVEAQVQINKQIIIVDDGSKDESIKEIEKFPFKSDKIIIKREKNYGKGAAIKIAKKHISGDIIIIQDADLEYSPTDYGNLIKPIISKKSSVVYGSRVLGKVRYDLKGFISFFRVFGNHIMTLISNFINNQNLTDAHTCYKVFTKEVFDKIILKENGFSFCPEVTTKISKLGYNITEVPISYNGRSYKEGKKIQISDAFHAFKTIIKYKYFN